MADSFIVTGAAGFIGSHLIEALLAAKKRVVAVVRRTSGKQVLRNYVNLRAVIEHPLLSIIPVDLAGPSAIEELVAIDVEVWIHLAADAFVTASLRQPSSVVTNNVISTLNVLEAARHVRPAGVVVMSSSEVYGNHAEPLTEEFPLEPTTPYAASKAAGDRLAMSYYRTFGLPVTVARPFNCYGPRHTYDAAPVFIRKAIMGEPLEVTGDGGQTRDLTYVDDTVAALRLLADAPAVGGVYNIGTGTDTSMLRLAELICELAESDSEIRLVAQRQGEVQRLCADPTKLRETFGWQPSVTLEEGLRRNIEWFRKHGTCG